MLDNYGERQAARIRALYLKAILRQDIAFFDMEMSAGQAVERMAGDTFLIQDAIGEKVLCFEIVYYARGELQTDKTKLLLTVLIIWTFATTILVLSEACMQCKTLPLGNV
jgi:ABC-type multidrug transport system fused ATPase/permease subunit